MMKPVFCTLCISLLLVLNVNACRQEPDKSAGPPEKITIAYTTTFNNVLVHIAFVKGFFTEEGLDATPQPYPFGKIALQAVLEGRADLGTAADTPIMFAIMGGQKIAVLAAIQTSHRNTGIVARRDRGITKPLDLKGKKIGVTRGTTSDFFTEAFLSVHDIGRKQVTIVDLNPDEMAAALALGKIDAASTWNPVLAKLQRNLQNNGLTFYGEEIFTETFCVVAGQKFVKQRPEAVKKFLRALIKAETFVKEHPEASRRFVAEFIKADKVLLDMTWDIFDFRVLLDQSLLIDLEEQTRWAMKTRLTTHRNMPNYLDFVYADGLLAVRPEAVRIIR